MYTAMLHRLPADTPMYDMLKLFQTGRSHMVVLTDTPATARAAIEVAVKAAAAAEAAAAAAADAASDGSDHSSGGSPLASMLRGRKRKSKRFQFESPLLQPIEDPEDKPAEEEQQQTTVTENTSGAEIDAGPFAANGMQQQQQDASWPHTLQRSGSSGSRSKGRVGFQQPTGLHVSVVSQQDFVVGVSDSSSSLAQLQQSRAAEQQEHQQQLEGEGLGPIAVKRSSSGGSSSSKGGLRTRSKSGPMLMSLAIGQEGVGCTDILNGPEGVAVPIGVGGLLWCNSRLILSSLAEQL